MALDGSRAMSQEVVALGPDENVFLFAGSTDPATEDTQDVQVGSWYFKDDGTTYQKVASPNVWKRVNRSGANLRDVRTVTTTATILTDDDVVLCDHSSTEFTVTLPDAATADVKNYTITNINDAKVTVVAAGSDTVLGDTGLFLHKQESIDLFAVGTDWKLV